MAAFGGQLGGLLAGEAGGLDDDVDVRAGPGGAGGVGEHGDARGDAELGGGARGGHGDVGQLLGGGVGVDGAVAEGPHAVLHRHEEDGGDDGDAGGGLDDLEGGDDRVRGRVGSARDHAVGVAHVDHHGAEVGHVGDLLAGLLEGDALLGAQARELFGVALEVGGVVHGDDLGGAQVEAELAGALGDIVGLAHEGDVGDAGGEDLGGSLQDAVVVGLGQDDTPAVGAGALDEIGLEGERGDGGGGLGGAQGGGGIVAQRQGQDGDVGLERGGTTGQDNSDDGGGSGLGAQAGGGDLFGEQLGAGTLCIEGEDDAGSGGGGEGQVPGHVVEGAVRGLTGGDDERVVAGGADGFDRGGQGGRGTEGGVGGRRAGQGVDGGDAENAGQLFSSEGGCLRRSGGDDDEAGHSNAPLMREICCGSQGPLDQY